MQNKSQGWYKWQQLMHVLKLKHVLLCDNNYQMANVLNQEHFVWVGVACESTFILLAV